MYRSPAAALAACYRLPDADWAAMCTLVGAATLLLACLQQRADLRRTLLLLLPPLLLISLLPTVGIPAEARDT